MNYCPVHVGTKALNGPVAEKRERRICANRKIQTSLCIRAVWFDLRCSSTPHKDLVDDTGLIVKLLTRRVPVQTGLGLYQRICPKVFLSAVHICPSEKNSNMCTGFWQVFKMGKTSSINIFLKNCLWQLLQTVLKKNVD